MSKVNSTIIKGLLNSLEIFLCNLEIAVYFIAS